MSEAEVAADLFKRDREAEQAFESIVLNFARHAVLPHTVDRGLERGECRLHRAKVGRIGLTRLLLAQTGRSGIGAQAPSKRQIRACLQPVKDSASQHRGAGIESGPSTNAVTGFL